MGNRYPIGEYKLIGFRTSTNKKKKYDAIIQNKERVTRYIPFGDKSYQHYRDVTPNKTYSYLDHNDTERRRLYRVRHAKDIKPGYYSPGYFAWYYLW